MVSLIINGSQSFVKITEQEYLTIKVTDAVPTSLYALDIKPAGAWWEFWGGVPGEPLKRTGNWEQTFEIEELNIPGPGTYYFMMDGPYWDNSNQVTVEILTAEGTYPAPITTTYNRKIELMGEMPSGEKTTFKIRGTGFLPNEAVELKEDVYMGTDVFLSSTQSDNKGEVLLDGDLSSKIGIKKEPVKMNVFAKDRLGKSTSIGITYTPTTDPLETFTGLVGGAGEYIQSFALMILVIILAALLIMFVTPAVGEWAKVMAKPTILKKGERIPKKTP